MPYIEKRLRMKLMPDSTVEARTPGELNYQIAILIQRYLRHQGTSYTALNEIVGVLECAKSEFYRRIVVGYEDLKIRENGDVYDGPYSEDL